MFSACFNPQISYLGGCLSNDVLSMTENSICKFSILSSKHLWLLQVNNYSSLQLKTWIVEKNQRNWATCKNPKCQGTVKLQNFFKMSTQEFQVICYSSLMGNSHALSWHCVGITDSFAHCSWNRVKKKQSLPRGRRATSGVPCLNFFENWNQYFPLSLSILIIKN